MEVGSERVKRVGSEEVSIVTADMGVKMSNYVEQETEAWRVLEKGALSGVHMLTGKLHGRGDHTALSLSWQVSYGSPCL